MADLRYGGPESLIKLTVCHDCDYNDKSQSDVVRLCDSSTVDTQSCSHLYR